MTNGLDKAARNIVVGSVALAAAALTVPYVANPLPLEAELHSDSSKKTSCDSIRTSGDIPTQARRLYVQNDVPRVTEKELTDCGVRDNFSRWTIHGRLTARLAPGG